jgi:hypothetical protein
VGQHRRGPAGRSLRLRGVPRQHPRAGHVDPVHQPGPHLPDGVPGPVGLAVLVQHRHHQVRQADRHGQGGGRSPPPEASCSSSTATPTPPPR